MGHHAPCQRPSFGEVERRLEDILSDLIAKEGAGLDSTEPHSYTSTVAFIAHTRRMFSTPALKLSARDSRSASPTNSPSTHSSQMSPKGSSQSFSQMPSRTSSDLAARLTKIFPTVHQLSPARQPSRD